MERTTALELLAKVKENYAVESAKIDNGSLYSYPVKITTKPHTTLNYGDLSDLGLLQHKIHIAPKSKMRTLITVE